MSRREITHSDPHNLETPWRPGINALFPLPIFINQADPERFKIIDDEFQSVISKIEFTQRDGWNADTHMLSPDPFSKSLIHEYNCEKFMSFLDESIKAYVTPILRHNQFGYSVTESWMTKTVKGKYAQEHSHGTADISGVYYIDTIGEDGNLLFDNIHSNACSNVLIAALKAKEIMPLENGLIMLWPGHLKHGTFVNKTDHERISLSFNICLGRKGFDELYSKARL